MSIDAISRPARWAAVYAHRDRLLRIATARLDDPHDAEDCVQEAMLRCVEFERLDEARLGQFLTSVTVRLCADVHRARARGDRLARRMGTYCQPEPGPEESVCDQAETVWLAQRVDELTPRQREVVEARASGLSCHGVAERLLVPYTTVESALARARRSLRGALESTFGVIALSVRRMEAGTAAAVTAAVVTQVGWLAADLPERPQPQRPAAVTAPVPEVRPPASGAPVRPAAARPRPAVTSGPAAVRRPPAPAQPAPDLRLMTDPTYDPWHGYTQIDRVAHCAEHGVSAGERFQCRYPDGDPHNNEHEYAGTPAVEVEL